MLRRARAGNAPRPRTVVAAGGPDALATAVFGQASAARVLGEDEESRKRHLSESEEEEEAPVAAPVAAWDDADDATFNVDIAAVPRSRKLRASESETAVSGKIYMQRLRAQFEKLHGRPLWAEASGALAQEDEDGESLPVHVSGMLKGKGRGGRLLSGSLDVARVRDLNHEAISKAAVQQILFHPHSAVAFTAGLDKTLRIFQVDGKANALLQSVFIPDLPILSAAWARDGAEVVLAGHRKYFYSYDVSAGAVRRIAEVQGHTERSLGRMWLSPDSSLVAFIAKNGTLVFVSNATKQWAFDLKMNGSVYTIAFFPDSKRVLTAGGDGLVYVWDLTSRECIHVFTDEGSLGCTQIAVSPDGRYVACGAESGVVNLYDETCLREARPKPLKAFMNLTTSVDTLEFNHDSQLLAMGSRFKKDCLRMAHVASATVFANWPTSATPLGYVSCVSFSPHSGYIAIGNDKGKVLLYRLSHYDAF
eukprot:m.233670 g.233670  ORF g.233670 m.233670 type:complete len:477 (-) comp12548_c0_seq1:99-1529(-)